MKKTLITTIAILSISSISYAFEIDVGIIPSSTPNPIEYELHQNQQIKLYMYDITYTNGKTIKQKISATMSSDEYLKSYKSYVKSVDNEKILMYTMRVFKKKFGKKGVIQLHQGSFGRDEYDLVVENRKKRGLKGM
jgi:hypothetical protein